jgi:iron(III) transport system permease protein
LAAIATPLSGLLGLSVSYLVTRTSYRIRHAIEWTSLLTFAVPGTVVGIGYILAFNRPPLLLQGTWMAIALLFVFRNAPVGIRAGIAGLMQIDRSIEEASTNLGANRSTTVRKILLPLLMPVFFSGLAFAFVRCMNAVSAVIFVVSGRWNLLTISIMNYFENGELSRAAALCVILVILVLGVIGLLKLLLPSKPERGFVATN